VPLTFLPSGLVPLVVTVRLLPSFETTIRPLIVVLPFFLLVSAKGVIVDHFVGPHVGSGIARDRVLFADELACPFIVRRLTVAIYSIKMILTLSKLAAGVPKNNMLFTRLRVCCLTRYAPPPKLTPRFLPLWESPRAT
jgi:hypothetical protein